MATLEGEMEFESEFEMEYEGEYEGEFEGEYEAAPTTLTQAQAELMAAVASQARTEAEAALGTYFRRVREAGIRRTVVVPCFHSDYTPAWSWRRSASSASVPRTRRRC